MLHDNNNREAEKQVRALLFRHVLHDTVILVLDVYPKNRKAYICVSKEPCSVREMAEDNLSAWTVARIMWSFVCKTIREDQEMAKHS